MFKGTERHPAGAFSKAVSSLGGQENAFTSYDYTPDWPIGSSAEPLRYQTMCVATGAR
jgi:hypothetical protein